MLSRAADGGLEGQAPELEGGECNAREDQRGTGTVLLEAGDLRDMWGHIEKRFRLRVRLRVRLRLRRSSSSGRSLQRLRPSSPGWLGGEEGRRERERGEERARRDVHLV